VVVWEGGDAGAVTSASLLQSSSAALALLVNKLEVKALVDNSEAKALVRSFGLRVQPLRQRLPSVLKPLF
jgi:hypothetical protein